MLGTAFLIMSAESRLKPYIAISGLLAVVAILITAPLGAIGIDKSYRKMLVNDNDAQ